MSTRRVIAVTPLVLAIALVACAGKTPPPKLAIEWPEKLDHASTPATHREAALHVLDSSGVQAVMTAMIDVSLEAQVKQNPILKPYQNVLREFLTKYLSYEAIRDDLAKAYMDRFDELQLRQISAFYGTPTGQLAIKKLPELAQVGAVIGTKRVEEHQAELVEMIQKAMREQQPRDSH